MDNREIELYLTKTDTKVLTICTIIGSVFYVSALLMTALGFRLTGITLILLALFTAVSLLVYFVVVEVKFRYDEIHKRSQEVYDIVHYCYPTMTDKQYKKYFKLAKKSIRKNKRCLMTMKFRDLLEADKWAQTVEHIKLERKWTYQLSLSYNCKIRG